MKIQEKSNGQFVVTIPKNLAKAKGWKGGQEVEWRVADDGSLKVEEV